MKRSLLWFWRSYLAVGLGCAIATAVLTGSLVVGDSVRGSLRDLAIGRLGAIEAALIGSRFVREELADDVTAVLASATDTSGQNSVLVAPAVLVPAAARHAASGRRHQHTTLYGVDERFFATFTGDLATLAQEGGGERFPRRPGQVFPSALANQALARELGAVPGDEILVTFDAVSTVPRESLVGRREEGTVESLRLTIVEIIGAENRGSGPDLGRFSLDLSQSTTPTLFLPLPRLQRALGQRGRVNALLARGAPVEALNAGLGATITADDLGFTLRSSHMQGVLESQRLVLSDPEITAALAAAEALDLTAEPVLTYLANAIESGPSEARRRVPYSTVSALDPKRSTLVDREGAPIPKIGAEEIVLDTWTADDLAARPGDQIELTWYEVGPHEELTLRQREFRLTAIAAMTGLAVDGTLTPPYPGMSEVDDISGWRPPFPIDFDAIREVDEAYWDDYGAAPKAFVSLATGQSLWGSRFGQTTSLRLTPGEPGSPLDPFRPELLRRLDPASVGLAFRPIRQQALEGSVGATDFSQLFLGFGFFLIGAAALLTSLLFRLGLEERRSEVGLFLALGFPTARIRRRFLAEGMVVGGFGVLVGSGGAVLFAAAMLLGLRTWWLPAVGTSALALHLEPMTVVIGAGIGWILVAVTIVLTVRHLAAETPVAALASRPEDSELTTAGTASGFAKGSSAWTRRWMVVGLGGGSGLLLLSPWLPSGVVVGATLAAGAALLVGGMAAFSDRVQHWPPPPRPLDGPTLWTLGVRNVSRQHRRSVLSVAMIASACFVVTLVTAFRGESEVGVEELEHRAGGYALVAESSLPVTVDLDDSRVRARLGMERDEPASTAGTELSVSPFRLRPGDDASCLNLYRPSEPRVLGVPAAFREAGRFAFHSAIDDRENPWTLLGEPLEAGVYPAIADFASAQWILHKGLGDSLEFPVEGGPPIQLRLVALLDGSLFQSELLVGEETFVELFPERAGYQFFLLEAPTFGGAEAPGAIEAITTEFESALQTYGFDVQESAARLAGYDAIERTYLATFQTLGGLGFLLGTLGLGVVLLRNVLERRSELALLLAVGFRPTTLTRAVVVENGTLLIAGVAIGTVAGLAAAAPQILAGYRALPWGALAASTLGLLSAGALATLLAARRVRHLRVLENL